VGGVTEDAPSVRNLELKNATAIFTAAITGRELHRCCLPSRTASLDVKGGTTQLQISSGYGRKVREITAGPLAQHGSTPTCMSWSERQCRPAASHRKPSGAQM
jgi:hypothetical protein